MGKQRRRQFEFAVGPAEPILRHMTAASLEERSVGVDAGQHAALLQDQLAQRDAEPPVIMARHADERRHSAARAEADAAGARRAQGEAVDAVGDTGRIEPDAIDHEMHVWFFCRCGFYLYARARLQRRPYTLA